MAASTAESLDLGSMAMVTDVVRVADVAKHHLERSILAAEGLSYTAFKVLRALWADGEAEFHRLAAQTDVAKGTLTGVLTALEARELVARRRHGDDRRRLLASCTPHGDALMAALVRRVAEEERHLVGRLRRADRDELCRLLRDVLRSLEVRDG